RQQIAELQATTAENDEERKYLSTSLNECIAQIDELNQTARETQEAHLTELAEKDEQISKLDLQLENARIDFAEAESAATAQVAEITEQLARLKTTSENADTERARLVATIANCESRIKELTAASTDAQRSYAAELADRDSRIVALGAELETA